MEHLPLILAGDSDPHVEAVVSRLAARGVASLRLNKALLPNSSLSVSHARVAFGDCDLHKVTAVWNRRMLDLILPEGMRPKWRSWCEQEFTHALLGGLLRLGVPWVSDPLNIRRASYKALQLQVASKVAGLSVPDYMVTSNPTDAQDFVHRVCAGHAVIKPLGRPLVSDGGTMSTIFTSKAGDIEPHEWAALRYAPSIFQRLVPKRAEVRVTVVGDQLFAASIDVSQVSDVDYRKADPYTLPHSVITLPPHIAKGCLALREYFGLRFAAIDFLLDEGGAYHFLELNPNGQWLWVEEITGLPIAQAIADELCGTPGSRPGHV